ncbi:MAG: hypothetical protein IJ368_10195, partial [Oscillospiraceae bacterium]|nr:hypothetical protein [Oscillospiraceae bacterium]
FCNKSAIRMTDNIYFFTRRKQLNKLNEFMGSSFIVKMISLSKITFAMTGKIYKHTLIIT